MATKSPLTNDHGQTGFHDCFDLLRNAPIGFFISTPEFSHSAITPRSSYLKVNPALAKMYGYSTPEELIGSITDIARQVYASADDRTKLSRILENQEEVANYECVLRRRDGSEFWASINARAVRDETGDIIQYHGFMTDITDRKRAEQELRQSEAKHRGQFETMSLAVIYYDGDGKVISANPAAERMFGASESQMIGTKQMIPHWKVLDEDGKRLSEAQLPTASALQTGQMVGPVVREIIHSENQLNYWLSITAVPIFFSGEKTPFQVYAIFEDITERKNKEIQQKYDIEELRETRKSLELRLQQAEKMNALSRISAGVAHEILNPLNIISLEMQIFKSMDSLPPGMQEEVDVCIKQIERIVAIADNLKQFSRTSRETLVLSDISSIINELLQMYATQMRIEEVEVSTQYDAQAPSIPVDVNKIDQVLINLLTNALAAMEGMEIKRLDICTRMVRSAGKDYLRIEVADTGTGIIKKDLLRVFDPFYTTKDQGKGTGMGLSISHGIVQQHGGKIWAENNRQGGATFFIDLPVNEADKEGQPPRLRDDLNPTCHVTTQQS
ncbi:PAS domain S-box protein [Desulfonatronum sp. SC1]|uniref:PAS domain S-box protein n=1 Tax=Desulfonatronum sp. SC1 TaxID=2109626 RepID=UPI0013049A2D|nr:PAS domain S-box protein [Desulfonatronum sp. SC1]